VDKEGRESEREKTRNSEDIITRHLCTLSIISTVPVKPRIGDDEKAKFSIILLADQRRIFRRIRRFSGYDFDFVSTLRRNRFFPVAWKFVRRVRFDVRSAKYTASGTPRSKISQTIREYNIPAYTNCVRMCVHDIISWVDEGAVPGRVYCTPYTIYTIRAYTYNIISITVIIFSYQS